MAGTIVADDIQHSTAGSVGTEYVVGGSAKVWVNFNGQGTIATRDSLNVSSLTDHGTGDYTVTFSNALDNSNYATQITGEIITAYILGIYSVSTGSVRGRFYNGSVVATDTLIGCFNIDGDLS